MGGGRKFKENSIGYTKLSLTQKSPPIYKGGVVLSERNIFEFTLARRKVQNRLDPKKKGMSRSNTTH